MDTFDAVTGIIWPSLPPWPDLQARAKRRADTGGKAGKKARAAAALVVPPIVDSATPDATAAFSSEVELPEEFSLLKAGPPADAAIWNGTGRQRFLQMREVDAIDHGGEWEGGDPASRGAGAPLRKPALGEYVGGCRPNELLVATMVKAHGRRGRLDDACRTVLRMVDWGLRPDAAVLNSLAAAAVWNGRMDLAIEVRGLHGAGVLLFEACFVWGCRDGRPRGVETGRGGGGWGGGGAVS